MNKMVAAVALLTAVAGGSPRAATPPPLPAEHPSVAQIGPRGRHWIYLFDGAYNNEIDSRIWVFDADSYRRLGQIDTGFMPGVNVSPDGQTTVVATTYFARGGHGTRTDVVELNDNTTLAKTGEIVIPSKHAQTLPLLYDVAFSSDGRFIYTAYMTPAESIGVLDAAKKSVVGEIDTAGCTLVFPSGANRVSSICESGKLLTLTLDAQGHETSRATSEQFFNTDEDPVFAQAVPMTNGYAFVSFLGMVHEVDLSHPDPVFRAPWPLVTDAEKGVWRPGGNQVGAIHRSLGRLYVAMHRGGEGSHKEGGSELWVFDMKSHRRLARWPFNTGESGKITAVQVSQDATPLLFTATDTSDLVIFDGLTGHLRHVEKKLGQTPLLIMNP